MLELSLEKMANNEYDGPVERGIKTSPLTYKAQEIVLCQTSKTSSICGPRSFLIQGLELSHRMAPYQS